MQIVKVLYDRTLHFPLYDGTQCWLKMDQIVGILKREDDGLVMLTSGRELIISLTVLEELTTSQMQVA